MNEFSNYRPVAWLEDGLTVQPAKVMHKAAAKQNRSWKVAFTAYAFSIGMVVSGVTLPQTGQVTHGPRLIANSEIPKVQVTRDGEVPVGYWANLITVLRNSPALPDDSSSTDPEPLF